MIFISYRRDDASGYAGRIFDRLQSHFGPGYVFMDLDTLQPGQDFHEELRKAVCSSTVLIAVIGHKWLTASDEHSRLRLEDPEDLVRLEISLALETNIRVIPVLV